MAVYIYVDAVTVGEGDGTAVLTLKLTEANDAPVSVSYTLTGGTASSSTDYVAASGTATFNPGETTFQLTVNLRDDATAESWEYFWLRIYNPSANVAGINREYNMISIVDDDNAAAGDPIVSIGDVVVNEQEADGTPGTASFTISLDREADSAVSVRVDTSNGTATAGLDYTAISNLVVTFAPGEVTKTIDVALLNDGDTEAAETFNVVLSNLNGVEAFDTVGVGTIGASDAPLADNAFLRADPVTVGEGQAYVDFVVRLSAPLVNPAYFYYTVNDGNASGTTDYVDQAQYVYFQPGETVKTVRVAIRDDATAEGSEYFFLRMYGTSANLTVDESYVQGVIIDDDNAAAGDPVVSIGDVSVSETGFDGNPAVARFTINLDRDSNSEVSVTVNTAAGTAAAGSDFAAINNRVITFAPGEVTKTIEVALVDDGDTESAEKFDLVLSSITGASTFDARGTATIVASDAPLADIAFITVDEVTVGEGQAYADFTLRLSAPLVNAGYVYYDATNGTATSTTDYVAQGQYIYFQPGETVRTVRVALRDDATAEGIEHLNLRLYNASTNLRVDQEYTRAYVIDDDNAAAGDPVMSIGDVVVNEQDFDGNPGTARFTITLDRDVATPVTVTVNTAAGTATGSDFTAINNRVITFAPGEVTKTVEVQLTNDATTEASEQFSLVLSSLSGATAFDTRATATIAANDAPVQTAGFVKVSGGSFSEGDGYADFVLTLNTPLDAAAYVYVATYDGTATAADDYVDVGTYVYFQPGETVQTVRIALRDNVTAEALQNFLLRLYNASTNLDIEQEYQSAYIVDDDSAAAGSPVMSIGDVTVNEQGFDGNPGKAQFTITLDRDATTAVTVTVNTAGGTATAGSDFVAINNLVLTFAPGEVSKTVEVSLLNDGAAEAAEQFNLVLSSITGATSGDPVGSAVIAANGTPQAVSAAASVNDVTVAEDQGYAMFTISLSTPLTAAGYVYYDTVDGTATAADDYVNTAQYVYFLPGETTKNVFVPLRDNVTAEAIQGFQLRLYSPSSNITIADGFGDATILDDEPNPVYGEGLSDDTYELAAITDQIIDTGGNDTVEIALTYALPTAIENLTLTGAAAINGTGTAAANRLTGNSAVNTLTGLAGDDTLDGGGGNDTMVGGDGDDTYFVAQGGDVVTETADGGTDIVFAGVSYGLSVEVEHLTLTGSAANGTGNASANAITGNAVANRLTGLAGADTLNGGGGNDTLNGGGGNDTYIVDATGDVVEELAGQGSDTVFASATHTLAAHVDDLVLVAAGGAINGSGNDLANRITGNNAKNTINGGLGADTMTGGAGNDSYVVDDVGDQVVEAPNQGTDLVRALISYTLADNVEQLQLIGTAVIDGSGNALDNPITGNGQANRLSGLAGNDRLDGGIGNDTLGGGNGSDFITGGAGIDILNGGGGVDTFQFTSAGGADRVLDFVSETDRLRFSQAALPVGNGDLVIDAAATVTGPGGFLAAAELVIVTTDIAGGVNVNSAAAAIGSASSAYAIGDTRLFAVDNGTHSGVFLFTSSGADATVSVEELRLVALLNSTEATTTGDYGFIA